MAHAAIAYAKTKRRRRAHGGHLLDRPGRDQHGHRRGARARQPPAGAASSRGDVFANRRPDPVLQQIEDFDDGTVSANDCFRPVTRYFDRITRPEHLLTALPRALAHDDRPGRLRPGLPRLLPGRAGRGLRLPGELLRAARLAHPPARARSASRSTRSSPAIRAAQEPGDRRRRRRALLRRRGPARRPSPTRRNIPVVETQAGKGATALGAPAELRLARRHRLGLRQRSSARRPTS